MRTIFLLIVLSCGSAVLAQDPVPTPTPKDETDSTAPVTANSTSVYVRPSAKTRRNRFINSTVGPVALGRMVATAGFSTWRNSPEEWGTKWEGFGRRVASNFGKNAIKQTTKFGLDEALKYDSHFYRSDKYIPLKTRFRRALLSPVTATNKNGKRVVGIPNIAATYASNIVAREAWYPDRYSWKDGVRSGTISLGFNAAFNLFREFVWRKK